MKAITPKVLLKDLRELIATARQDVARHVNSVLVLLYWRVGKRIQQDILKEKRAEYGEQIVSAVSRELAAEFGQGFSEKNLWHMIRFVEVFPVEEIVSTLSRQLGWNQLKKSSLWKNYDFNNLSRMRISTSFIRSKILSLVKKAVAP